MKTILGCITAVLLLASPIALAHSHLVEAQPAPNQVSNENPTRVTLRFSEKIEPAFSKIQVKSLSDGKSVTQGKARAPQGKQDTLEVALSSELAPGSYEVSWKATSVDTHQSHGSYRFTIKTAHAVRTGRTER